MPHTATLMLGAMKKERGPKSDIDQDPNKVSMNFRTMTTRRKVFQWLLRWKERKGLRGLLPASEFW
jgi:hypothetical protein